MSRNQRLTFLGIAALIAVVAVVIFASSGGDDEQEAAGTAATATATATPSATEESGTPTPSPTPTPKPQPPLLQAGKVTKLRVTEGETVSFRVKHDAPEEVHVHGYDIKKDLTPNETATISFKATITGIFEIELEGAAEQIGELRVDPK
jgi:FtsP/CotA-like multicopper oxidase with cupredoxin domain